MINLLFLLALNASAAQVVTEGFRQTSDVIYVATTTPRVYFSTRTYGGSVSGVGIFTSSNAVFSTTSSDNCVIYATGSATCLNFVGGGAGLTSITPGYAASSTTSNGFLGTFTNTTFGTCITTLTFTTTGGKVAVFFSGTGANNTNNSGVYLNVLEDGAFVSPYTSSVGITGGENPAGVSNVNLSFYIVFRAPSSASHSYCLTPRVNANTGSFTTATSGMQFGIYELK